MFSIVAPFCPAIVRVRSSRQKWTKFCKPKILRFLALKTSNLIGNFNALSRGTISDQEHSMARFQHSWLRELFLRLTGRIRQRARKEPEPPVDPYAYVTAPKKPWPSNRSGAAVAELPED